MDLMIDCQPPAMSYRRAEVLALPFKRRYEKIEIMPEVSCCLFTLWDTASLSEMKAGTQTPGT